MTELLQTKLHIPTLRSNNVSRTHLVARLNSRSDARLTLVSAPAGYGKTTLVVEWLTDLRSRISDFGRQESAGQIGDQRSTITNRVAWLSLDENDNDPRRFLAYLFAALRQVEAGIGQTAEAMLQSPQPPPKEAILTALVNDIGTTAPPFLLVLDDYHVIHTPPIHEQLNFLLENQPPQMRMVIITREDPPLPIARMRARGQMVEIRQDDLRFTLEECAGFLNRVMGLDLPRSDIAALERRTEGWIAGLQLAALSMRGRDDLSGFIESFTGGSHFVLDYLIEEVFKQQPAEVQDFLLKTSILERLSGPLCDVVAGRTGSRSLLERLEHANLFIVPLDQACEWYRYHHLFADLLRQRLQSTGIFVEAELHRLASQWFEANGFFPEAIGHSLAAQDWEKSADLIGSQSTLLLRRGELIILLGWFKSLPGETVFSRSTLCRDYGWALMLTGQLDAAVPYLERAERLSQEDEAQLGQVMVAKAYLARVRGDHLHAVALSKQALELIAEDDILHRGLVMFTLGFSLFSVGHLQEAEPVLMEGSEAARASGNDFVRMTTLSLLAASQKNQGRLRRAAEFCQQVLTEAHGSPMAAHAQVFLASILYEWNDLEAAAVQVAQALKASQSIGNIAIQPDIYQTMTRVYLAQGSFASASSLLDEFQQMAQAMGLPAARAIIAALRAEAALRQGDIPSASHWAAQITAGASTPNLGILHNLTQARLLLAEGKGAEAAKILKGVYDSVAQTDLVAMRIELLAMQAVAAETPSDALQFLREALKMAQPEGFIRTFVDRGEPMKVLLERLKSEGGDLKPYLLTLLAAFGGTGARSRAQPLVEPMSERELEILRLMAAGLSNREIAERLVITVGTTKSHVHHILEKLDSASRSQAVAKARELELV